MFSWNNVYAKIEQKNLFLLIDIKDFFKVTTRVGKIHSIYFISLQLQKIWFPKTKMNIGTWTVMIIS